MGKLNNVKKNKLVKIKEDSGVSAPTVEKDVIESPKKKSLIGKVQFKANRKYSKSALSKLKKTDNSDKTKLESIKSNLLKQIKLSNDLSQSNDDKDKNKNELNFINRTNRLTNSLIKTIIKSNVSKPVDPDSKTPSTEGLLGLQNCKSITKKNKEKLKKQVWQERIGLIKNQLKEKADKSKREKTVITGDMKPMVDSLVTTEKTALEEIESLESSAKAKSKNSAEIFNLTRKEKREKNLERQKSKVTPKQSIRSKTSKEDMSLFNQLLEYKEFTNNPLETLKKTFNK